MEILYHVIFSSILAIILFPFLGWATVIVFLAGVLVDIDHYIWYCFRFKTLDIRKTYSFCRAYTKDSKIKGVFDFLHFIEFYILFFIFGFFYRFFWAILIGGLFHILLDYIDMRLHKETKFRLFSLVSWVKMNYGKSWLLMVNLL